MGDSYAVPFRGRVRFWFQPDNGQLRQGLPRIPRLSKESMTPPSSSRAKGARRRPPRHSEPREPSTAAGRLDLREEKFVRLLAEGKLYKEICDCMGVSAGVLRRLQRRAYRKLGAQNRTEATNRWRVINAAIPQPGSHQMGGDGI